VLKYEVKGYKMDEELERKLNSIIKLKTVINHSMNMTDQKLKNTITRIVRLDNEIASEDKQKTIEHFFNLLKKEEEEKGK